MGEPQPIERDASRQLTVHEYAALKNSEGALGSQRFSEGHLDRSQANSVKPGEQRSLFSMIKPDSAQQIDGEIYIATRDQTGTKKYNQRKRSHQDVNYKDALGITFDDDDKTPEFNIRKRKTSLPVIQGVNQKSLSLLIDNPNLLN